MPEASSAHVGNYRGALPSAALATEQSGQSCWHKAWGRGQSRTWHQGLRVGQGGYPCFLVETMASHFHPIPSSLLMQRVMQSVPVPQREDGTAEGDQRTPGIFGDGSPMARGRGRGAGLFLHQSWPVTSEFPTPFQGEVICQQKLVQGDGEFSPALPISITMRFLSKYWW